MGDKVIFIDDDESLLSLYKTTLPPKYQYQMLSDASIIPMHEDYQVLTCNNGVDSIKIIQSYLTKDDPIALAFVDYRFDRGINGATIAELIREIDPDIEIVFATSCNRVELIENISKKINGQVVYFRKPFNVTDLSSMISKMLIRYHNKKKNRVTEVAS